MTARSVHGGSRPVVRDAALSAYRMWRLFIEPERLKMRRTVRTWISECPSGATVVEVGGGTSLLKPVIERAVARVHYVSGDIAPTNRSDLVFDATALPVGSERVDAVLAVEVLEHLEHPQAMLDEIARVLRPGGMAVITVPFMFGVHDFRDYHRFTPLGFSTMLARCELTLEETVQRGGTFVSASTLIRTLVLNRIVGEPVGWRAQGTRKKILWLIATVVLTPWVVVTLSAMAVDAVVDRRSKSPPGYFFRCRKAGSGRGPTDS